MVQEINIFHYILYFISLFLGYFSSPEAPCGDLLQNYAQKPYGVNFVDCKEGSGQVIAEAIYKVAAEDVDAVEQFFVNSYGMGELEFVCCGWEPKDGKTGQPMSKALRQLDANYSLLISMHGNAEVENEDGTYRIETNRSKIQYFYVTVQIVEV